MRLVTAIDAADVGRACCSRTIIWRLGGNVFCDTGTVWPSLAAVDLGNLAFDAGLGLRFYMPDFVARVDVAWSGEGMGLYFNFGHIF